jgi:hypothetical protein
MPINYELKFFKAFPTARRHAQAIEDAVMAHQSVRRLKAEKQNTHLRRLKECNAIITMQVGPKVAETPARKAEVAEAKKEAAEHKAAADKLAKELENEINKGIIDRLNTFAATAKPGEWEAVEMDSCATDEANSALANVVKVEQANKRETTTANRTTADALPGMREVWDNAKAKALGELRFGTGHTHFPTR